MLTEQNPGPSGGLSQSVTAPSPRLNLSNCDDFKSEAIRRIGNDCRRLTIDMSETEFVDSSGIGALVALRKAVSAEGTVVLVNPTEFVRRVLRLTRMETVFQIEPPLD